MKPIERILAAVDLSEISSEVLKAASYLSEKIGGSGHPPSLSVLHVVQQTDFEGNFFGPANLELIDQIEEKAKEELQKQVHSTLQKGAVTPEVKVGVPSVDIIRFAKKQKIQFLIAGTHSREGLERFLLGSVAESLVRQSECPIWIVKSKFSEPKKILILTDFSQHARSGFNLGIFLAKLFQASVHLIHVFDLPFLPSFATIDTSEYELKMREAVREEFQKWVEEAQTSKLEVTGEVPEGKVAEKVEEVIQKEKIDLVVMSTQGQTGLFHQFLGSTTTKIIRQISCSFITARPEGFRFKEIG